MRIGLSATQKPIEEVARFLIGVGPQRCDSCTIIDSGHTRNRDLALELPPAPLEAVMSGEVWTQVYDRLAELVREHRTTIIFVNTRRLAERVARHISERIGEEHVAAHHGSLARDRRLDAEQRLKRGELKALVATASLELGIDIGDVDLVCQIGSTRSINAFLQRVGRAGHSVGGTSKGRLFPLSRDELVECAALMDAVRRGELDRLVVPRNALDVLTQQIAAEVSSREWQEDELFDLVRRAYCYRDLPREEFDECIGMLAQGFSTRRGRHGALIHHDAVNRLLRPRKGGRLTAITSGGAIPDNADYKVMLEPEGHLVGTVNEDFAVESLQGDVFQLGNTSYRILRVERGTVRVEDAHGQPPSIPFWLGEAPGRSDELSFAVSRLRGDIERHLAEGPGAAMQWLTETVALDEESALQLIQYLAAGRAALGSLPTLDSIIFERFFDESGGMQLVIHSSYGSRVNRAWGLALRKRFCRTFNFELQAAATEDHIVLSLTQAHSFELAGSRAVSAFELGAPRARASAVRRADVRGALALGRGHSLWRCRAFEAARKFRRRSRACRRRTCWPRCFPIRLPAPRICRARSRCPTIRWCARRFAIASRMRWTSRRSKRLLRGLETGAIRTVARDLTEPSPLALEALNARPYAYLDDAPLEERRTQAVMSRRWIDAASAADLGRLDGQAIAKVREEAWPDAATPDELHDALSWLTFLTEEECRRNPAWPVLMSELAAQGRVIAREPSCGQDAVGADRETRAVRARAALVGGSTEGDRSGAARGSRPRHRAARSPNRLGLPVEPLDAALLALQTEGFALRGHFTPEAAEEEWCERGLLARIHRYTVKRLRAEIEPVQARDFLRFLFEWQRVLPDARMQGSDAVAAVLAQLEGFEAAAAAWETDILPMRISEYEPEWLDEHCRSGRFVWIRLAARTLDRDRGAAPIRSTPITLLARRSVKAWSAFTDGHDREQLTSKARAVMEFIQDPWSFVLR